MELKGKKVFFLGDSITQRYNATDLSLVYHAVIACERGCESFNYGLTSTRIARQSDAQDCGGAFVDRCMTMGDGADVIVIMGGTNDFGHGDAPLGTCTDKTPYTFFGACRLMLELVSGRYPDALIVVCSPVRRSDMSVPNASWGLILRDYADVLRQCAAERSLPYLDLMTLCPIDPENAENRARFAPDGVHPNDEGHLLLARTMEKFFDGI